MVSRGSPASVERSRRRRPLSLGPVDEMLQFVHPGLTTRLGSEGLGRFGRVVARLDDARFVGEHDGLHAVAQAELHQDACDVRLHGRLGDEELLRDLGVRESAGEKTEDLVLTFGE